MKLKTILFSVAFLLIATQTAFGQSKKLSGIITDYKNKPIKNVRIFVDSTKTSAKTNKKGEYTLTVSKKNKLITAFSKNHGVIDIEYTGQDKINFIFPEESKKLSKSDFYRLGYNKSAASDNYSNYTDMYSLLKAKYPNLRFIGEDKIVIPGGGASLSQGGLLGAAFFVNNTQVNSIRSIDPANVKKISVQRNTSSIYGSRVGSGGIIKITLK